VSDAVTTENDFQSALDAHPDDWQTRLVFADWLQDRGDPRADGYRALGVLRKRASRELRGHLGPNQRRVFGRIEKNSWGKSEEYGASCLPGDWYAIMFARHDEARRTELWCYFTTRHEAEDAAGIADFQLPPERRAELHATLPAGS
jgi:uncharacterized protein (TIGR02996 family)